MIIYLLHSVFLLSGVIFFILMWKWGTLSWSQDPAIEMIKRREESK